MENVKAIKLGHNAIYEGKLYKKGMLQIPEDISLAAAEVMVSVHDAEKFTADQLAELETKAEPETQAEAGENVPVVSDPPENEADGGASSAASDAGTAPEDEGADAPTADDVPFHILDGNNADVADGVAEITDVAVLNALLRAERKGKTRVGAVTAIEGRIAFLEPKEEPEDESPGNIEG